MRNGPGGSKRAVPWLASAAALVCPSLAHAQNTWLVSNDPAESPDFALLSEAVANPGVLAGDTVLISQGLAPYQEYAAVNRPLTIRAQAGELPVLVPGPNTGTGGSPLIAIRLVSGSNGSTVEGLRFAGVGVGTTGVMADVSAAQIHGCEFDALELAIYAGPSMFMTGCTFTDNVLAVRTHSGTTITGSVFSTSNPAGSSHLFLLGGSGNVGTSRFVGGPVARVPAGGRIFFTACEFADATIRADQFLLEGTAFGGSYNLDTCLLHGINSPTRGIIDVISAVTVVRNCTITDCSAPALVDRGGASGSTEVVNSIIWGNALGSLFNGAGSVTYSIVPAPIAGAGNLVTDPLFTNPAGGDFSVKRGSPAVDSGDSTVLPTWVTLDLAGNPRFVDDPAMLDTGFGPAPAVDRGAYELVPQGGCVADLTSTAAPGSPGYGVPNGLVNNEDFFYYLSLFSGSLGCGPGAITCSSPPDLTSTAIPGTPGYGILDGALSGDDFFYFLEKFVAGC